MFFLRFKNKPALQKGFSLVEILIVIGILSVLSTVVVTALNIARLKAQTVQAEIVINQLNIAIESLAADTGFWPGREAAAGGPEPQEVGKVSCGASASNNEVQDLGDPQAGLTADSGDYTGWDGPYIREVPLDPWGNKYFFDTDYELDGYEEGERAVVIGSYGQNGVGNNLYDEDDIIRVIFEGVCAP
ncbi:MAG: type II secretion system protein GspG [bacterium]|nr:type II secretion system protein GspG [bacterium]